MFGRAYFLFAPSRMMSNYCPRLHPPESKLRFRWFDGSGRSHDQFPSQKRRFVQTHLHMKRTVLAPTDESNTHHFFLSP